VSRYRFIAAEKPTYPVSLLCRVLGVSRASFYAWCDRGLSTRQRADQQLLEQIRQIHHDWRGSYGAPRVHAELREDHGIRCSRKRVARLMRHHDLVGCHRRRRRGLTRPDPKATPAPDLVGRLFDPGAPNRTWYADISYVPTQEGWRYLAAVLDGCSRKVVGWAMADHLRAELAVDALQMALDRRQPAAGLLHHSDRGSQYTAGVYTKALEVAGLRQSMGHVATCFDNAIAESLFATLKTELVHTRTWPTRQAARTAIYEYLEV
jgi:transposase InsO family protein